MPSPPPIDTRHPFCLIRRKNEGGVWLLTGELVKARSLSEIPRGEARPGEESFDSVSLVPFAQARERGFPVRDGGEPILSLVVRERRFIDCDEMVAALPRQAVRATNVTFDTSTADYEAITRKILAEEIGTGEGCNFVVARRCEADLEGFTPEHALSIYRSLLVNEYGTYWTFLFFDGRSFYIGATPERHIQMKKGEVMMNPISGTYRKPASGHIEEFKKTFREFLTDEKEIFELFMVTDEELKIMSDLCEEGGAVVGPLLKEMAKLIHTEYLLLGKSSKDVIDLLRRSMFAPTVTGSPLQSAFRVIERYESGSRSYYGGAIALLGHDADGQETLDAPITIRTLEIDERGHLAIRVGATLVRNSDPTSEVKETEAKIAGVLAAISATGDAERPPRRSLDHVDAEEVQILLQRRNLYLSRFWFEPQNVNYNAVPAFTGKRITIIDAEDSFSNMLKRMIEQMGATVEIVSFDAFSFERATDLTIVGPGPGDPTSKTDPKMVKLRGIVERLLGSDRPFMAECLGHQVLCHTLGFPVGYKSTPYQGTQEVIDLYGRVERVGFYNTFAGKATVAVPGVEVAADPKTKEIHALRAGRYQSVQFHLESILTPRGYELTRDMLAELLGVAA